MKIFLSFLFLHSIIYIVYCQNLTEILKSSTTFTDDMLDSIVLGKDSKFLLYEDILKLELQLKNEFSNLITIEEIGKSYENRSIYMITLTSNKNATSSLLITGAHHAREVISI